jgi:hypothetical protein
MQQDSIYTSENKNSVKIYNIITANTFNVDNEQLFPQNLMDFLELNTPAIETTIKTTTTDDDFLF